MLIVSSFIQLSQHEKKRLGNHASEIWIRIVAEDIVGHWHQCINRAITTEVGPPAIKATNCIAVHADGNAEEGRTASSAATSLTLLQMYIFIPADVARIQDMSNETKRLGRDPRAEEVISNTLARAKEPIAGTIDLMAYSLFILITWNVLQQGET